MIPRKIRVNEIFLRLIPEAFIAVSSWFFCSCPIVKIHASKVVIGNAMLIKLGIDKIQYERISVWVKFDSINLSIFPIISTIKNNSVNTSFAWFNVKR